MKIIKPGRDCEIYGTCENCKCEFMYDKSDVGVLILPDTDSAQDVVKKRYVRCPWCGNVIIVKHPNF